MTRRISLIRCINSDADIVDRTFQIVGVILHTAQVEYCQQVLRMIGSEQLLLHVGGLL